MLSVGTIIKVPGKVRKPKTAYEHIMADDEDGLIHEGQNYVVHEALPSEHADFCDLYKCDPTGFLKLARRPSDNDLLENEAKILRHLVPANAPDEKFYRYLPRVLHEVKHDERAGNVLPYFEGHLSLAEILKAYPAGIDFRDMVWMYKRMLVGIGFAHTQGVVHGAVLPPHILVHPTDHGAKIVDWSCAVTDPKDHIKVIFSDYEDFYPPEILRKQPVAPTADIFMAAKCAVALLGGDVKTNRLPDTIPAEIRDFFAPCFHEIPHHRPRDAWDLHEIFDKLLLQVVGKPTYRPFTLPEAL